MKIESALRDQYRKMAKDQGYRSRSSYKLLELDKKYNILKQNDTILDIGCAPGGWLQVSKKYCGPNGKVFGIDLNPIKPIPGTSVIQANIEDPNVVQIIKQRFLLAILLWFLPLIDKLKTQHSPALFQNAMF